MVATVQIGCTVEGPYGPFISNTNPDGTQRKKRKRSAVRGLVVESRGEKRWLVQFDNGTLQECASNRLRVVSEAPQFINQQNYHDNITSPLATAVLQTATNQQNYQDNITSPLATAVLQTATILPTVATLPLPSTINNEVQTDSDDNLHIGYLNQRFNMFHDDPLNDANEDITTIRVEA
jgi:hypothetical protein